jgi:putative redox protein
MSSTDGAPIAHAGARMEAEKYRVAIRAGHHALSADEHAALGGTDSGPAPHELLLAALSACTTITLRMYAERKAWPLTGLEVKLTFRKQPDRIDRSIAVTGDLTDEQKARLAEIAEKTPVTLTLKAGVEIVTELK